ncbi:isopenicillin N synthase family oxygenase [Ferrimonas lipolytica]|uniref:2-oxoglutarate-dependent ethylene/succinate-forming enzyme n=1 Tax=Ferrimonas lipolytica TaxID=2724191 RepID=A0A6H1UCS3_9GAMM|nr:isopenicillin N synthase family oxygenase [Ferrimonas lipolytica]QIZ76006.1 isopenicillin N synthase family oxygenase [Ferrimonas lipolytica]
MELVAVDYQAPDAAEQFVRSLHNTGFAVIKNHPISQELVETIYQQWGRFFLTDQKSNFRFDPKTQDGFFPADVSETAKGNDKKDLKEYFHFYPWGQCPDSLRVELASYYAQAGALASELLTWVQRFGPKELTNGYSEPLPSMVYGSDKTLLRVLHYPVLQGDEPKGAMRAAAHEDINLLTILPAANAKGLQLKDGQDWVEVAADFGHLVVNVGDMLQEASNGYFPSTTHRVVNPDSSDNSARISLPLFLHPRPEVVLSERYTAEGYLTERLKELGVL